MRYCKSNESESRALFSLKYHRAFERFFAVLACWRVGATIRQVKRKFTRLIKKSRKQMFEQPKYRRKFTSRNGISASFPIACSRRSDSGARAKKREKTRGDWGRGRGNSSSSPVSPHFFPVLSFALFFARAPLSERLEQASFPTGR